MFDSGRISDASAYLKYDPGLQWPHGAPAAIALTREEIPALRPGMVVPILRFQLGIVGFDQLAKPAAYYVVITDNIDGRIRLSLGHQSDDGAAQYPYTGVRTALMEHITEVLLKKYSPLIGLNTTVTQRTKRRWRCTRNRISEYPRSPTARTEGIHPSPARGAQRPRKAS